MNLNNNQLNQSISSLHQQSSHAVYTNQQQLNQLQHSNYSMESEEGDIEDNRGHSLSSSKSNLSEHSIDQQSMHSVIIPKQKVHQFLVRTFSSPTKCNHCTSLMVSLKNVKIVFKNELE